MKLKLILIQRDINSVDEVQDLNEIQKKQLTRGLKEYFGKKRTFSSAFKEIGSIDYYQVVDLKDPQIVLYDFWEINSDSGNVFFANTINAAGVQMIQGYFGILEGFKDVKSAKILVEAFTNAERSVQEKNDYKLNKNGLVDDFISDEFVPKDTKQWIKFLKNQKVSEKFIKKHHNTFNKTCWSLVCKTASLSEEFISKFSKKIDWKIVSEYQNLSEAFITKRQDYVDWKKITLYQKLSVNFIRKFQNKVDWKYVSSRQKLSEAFILEFMDKISWNEISSSQNLSEAFIRKYQNKLNWDLIMIYQNLSEAFIREFIDTLSTWGIWYNISKHQNFSIPFIKEFEKNINWDALSMNLHLTDKHLQEFKEKLNWGNLINFGRNLTEKQLKEFQDYISLPETMCSSNWKSVLKFFNKFPISEKFKQEILEKIKSTG